MLSNLQIGNKVVVYWCGDTFKNIRAVLTVKEITSRQIILDSKSPKYQKWNKKTGRQWGCKNNYHFFSIEPYSDEVENNLKKQCEMKDLCKMNGKIRSIESNWNKVPKDVQLKVWDLVKSYI